MYRLQSFALCLFFLLFGISARILTRPEKQKGRKPFRPGAQHSNLDECGEVAQLGCKVFQDGRPRLFSLWSACP